ncbi:MAG: hypothetical protein AAB705_01645 [Patescibacteria group bacterium]
MSKIPPYRDVTGIMFASKNSKIPNPGEAPPYIRSSIYNVNPDLLDTIFTLAAHNIVEAKKQKGRAWVPVVYGIAMTGALEILSNYLNIPGLAQIACGALGLIPTATGIAISRFQVKNANDLINRSQNGIRKSGQIAQIDPGNLYNN